MACGAVGAAGVGSLMPETPWPPTCFPKDLLIFEGGQYLRLRPQRIFASLLSTPPPLQISVPL